MNETVKLRLVGSALVMGIPKRIQEAFEVKPGDFVTLHYNPVIGQLDHVTVVKEGGGGKSVNEKSQSSGTRTRVKAQRKKAHH